MCLDPCENIICPVGKRCQMFGAINSKESKFVPAQVIEVCRGRALFVLKLRHIRFLPGPRWVGPRAPLCFLEKSKNILLVLEFEHRFVQPLV